MLFNNYEKYKEKWTISISMLKCKVIIKRSKNPSLIGIKTVGRELITTTKRNRIEIADLEDTELETLFQQVPSLRLHPNLEQYKLSIEDYMGKYLLQDREETIIKIYCPSRISFEIVGCSVESLVPCADVRSISFGNNEHHFMDPSSIDFQLYGQSRLRVNHARACKATGVQFGKSWAKFSGNFPDIHVQGNPPHTTTLITGTYSTSTGTQAKELLVDRIPDSFATQ